MATINAPVVITLDPSNPQTAPAGGYSITATGSAVNTIIIQGSNNTITASAALTGGSFNDGIFKIVGGDWITIQAFTMNENVANTVTTAASNNMTEWGVALLYATATNGAQNCTIQNNTIALNRTYQNTFGIYSNSTHTALAPTVAATATGATGGNSGLKVYGNTISNVNNGIVVVGPTAPADYNIGVDIGGASGATANTLTNFGTTGTFSGFANVSATVYGILVRNAVNVNISFNSVTSSNGGTTSGTLRGIYMPSFSSAPTGTITNTINNNTVSLTGGVSGTLESIRVEATTGNATTSLSINNNNITALTATVTSSGTVVSIGDAMANLTTTINGNTFTNLTSNTTGSFTFISHSFTMPATGSCTVNNNSIVTAFNKTGAGGTVTCMTTGTSSPNGTTQSNQNNNFSNITVTGATGITGLNSTDGLSTGSSTKTLSNNTFSNWTGGTSALLAMNISYMGNGGTSNIASNIITNLTGQSSVTGISMNSSGNLAPVLNIASNTITNLTSTGTGSSVTGITCSNTSPSININNNAIQTLSTTSASTVLGIAATGATANNVFANTIYDLNAAVAGATLTGISLTAASTNLCYNNMVRLGTGVTNGCAINGISETSGTNTVQHNSVYIGGAPTAGTANTFAFTSTVTTSTRVFQNNIFFNARSNSGSTGKHYAIRVGGTAASPAGLTSNYNVLFTTGTGGFVGLFNAIDRLTIFDWRTATGHDANSQNSDPKYIDPTNTTPNLHINAAVATCVEAQGTAGSVATDIDNQTRSGLTPVDIGADAGNFTPL
ncbi:MAG TPA: hypothetical protein VHL57_00345, partial [Flavobacteriales bacterium]|nr:hypothetical protein [Flavobacteriales bacterium]